MHKEQLVHELHYIALMLEIIHADSFRARAYSAAARSLETTNLTIEELIDQGKALELRGIGSAMFGHLKEWRQAGTMALYAELAQQTPAGLWEILSLPGIGPKKVHALYRELQITGLAELEYACNENRLLSLPGFGQKTQAKILEAITNKKLQQGKRLYAEVERLARDLQNMLASLPGVEACHIVGDFRRNVPVLDVLEFVLSGNVMDLSHLGQALEPLDLPEGGFLTGAYAGSVQGFATRLYTCLPEYLGTALVLKTGSAAHISALGMPALWRFATEESFYGELGLPLIPPPLREGLDELDLARTGQLPSLVTTADIKGLLHIHSTYSDGSAAILELAQAAKKAGYAYIGIADHSKSAFYAQGLTIERAHQQLEEIDALNSSGQLGEFKVLKGIEVDILPDGSLDYPDELLAQYDFCIASVHSTFRQGVEAMTQRIIRAMENPHVDIIGHLTGRLLLGRRGYEVDLDRILAVARATGTALELNASPRRLDLDWQDCRRARAAGVKIAINPDAHHIETLSDVRYGVLAAQKAGLSRNDLYVPRGVV